jgi:hypothetical protein
MAMGRKSGAVVEAGSGRMTLIELDQSTYAPTGSLITFGIIKDSKITDTTAQTSKADEGNNSYTLDSTREVKFSGTLMQRSGDDINFMVKTARNKLFGIYKEMSEKTIDGKYQGLHLGICKPTPNLDMSLPGGEIPFEFSVQPNSSSIARNLGGIFDDGDFIVALPTTTDTIGASEFWNLVEFTV